MYRERARERERASERERKRERWGGRERVGGGAPLAGRGARVGRRPGALHVYTHIYTCPEFSGRSTLNTSAAERRGKAWTSFKDVYLTGRAKIWPRLSYMCHIFSTAGCWCVAALVSVFWVSIYCHALNHSAACRMLSAQFLLICGLMRSHVERRCSHLGPTQNFKSPSILEYTNSIRSTAKFRTRNAEYETPPRTHSKIRKPQIIHTHPRCVSYG